MVHSRSKDSQPAFATQRVIAGENNHGVFADETVDDQLGQQSPQVVDLPRGLREEPVIVREVSVADGVTGDNQVRDIAMPDRNNPAGHQQSKRLKTRGREDRSERLPPSEAVALWQWAKPAANHSKH